MSVDGRTAYDTLSPLAAARALARHNPGMSRFCPPAILLHGTADKTVPVEGSVLMAEALQSMGVRGFEGGAPGLGKPPVKGSGRAVPPLMMEAHHRHHPTPAPPCMHARRSRPRTACLWVRRTRTCCWRMRSGGGRMS